MESSAGRQGRGANGPASTIAEMIFSKLKQTRSLDWRRHQWSSLGIENGAGRLGGLVSRPMSTTWLGVAYSMTKVGLRAVEQPVNFRFGSRLCENVPFDVIRAI